MKKSGQERRLHPRINQELPLKVIANGYDFKTSTQNVSCLGAYCSISKYIPPFTKVMVHLDLPIMAKTGNKNCPVECKGVVVRTEDTPNGNFNVAIFFNGIRDEQRKKISQYISQFIPENSPALQRM